jgi:hypothetical protein
MSEQSKSVIRLAAAVAGVLLLIVASVRYFGSSTDIAQGEVDDGSPYVIRSIPAGANVYINNELVGTTPYPYESFESGVLRIRLENANLAPAETLLIIPDDGPVPVFPTFVFTIPVELTSDPPGAQPIVNGRELRAYEVASYSVRATDTLDVEFELGSEASTQVRFSPLLGLVGEADTVRWKWRPANEKEPARLTGVFAQLVRVKSTPSGAAIYLDKNPVPIGYTDGRVAIPYGDHTLTLRLLPFDDFEVMISSSHDRSEPVSVILRRQVWLTAVDAQNPYYDLNAHVRSIRQGERYIVSPDDRLYTPGGVHLDGRVSEVEVSCEGYADTTIILASSASEITVAMRALPKHRAPEPERVESEMAWVRFVVKQGRSQELAGAEVFGVDKDNGNIVRYGPTDEDGILTTRVPLGDYDWWAAKSGYIAGKPNGERIKRSRKTKEITLKVKPL